MRDQEESGRPVIVGGGGGKTRTRPEEELRLELPPNDEETLLGSLEQKLGKITEVVEERTVGEEVTSIVYTKLKLKLKTKTGDQHCLHGRGGQGAEFGGQDRLPDR